MLIDREEIRNKHIQIAESRKEGSTYCPSEVARNLWPEGWREKMGLVREVADELIEERTLELLQKGTVVAGKATTAKGPIRLRKF
ncbi:MAG: DUF3253 domain-containing protein [Cyclobacteriaceae bacterium]